MSFWDSVFWVVVFGLVVEVLEHFFSLGWPILRCLSTFSKKDDKISSFVKFGSDKMRVSEVSNFKMSSFYRKEENQTIHFSHSISALKSAGNLASSFLDTPRCLLK